MRKKRLICALLCLALVISLSACSEGGVKKRVPNGQKSVEDVLQEQIAKAEGDAETELPEGGADSDPAGDKETGLPGGGTDGTSAGDAGQGLPAEGTDGTSAGDAGTELPDGGRQTGLNDNAPTPEAAADDTPRSLTDGIDVDLTTMSANMVYSEVYNMLCEPENYMGKTIRMSGIFSVYTDPTTNVSYYTCIIQDATACCAQGLEFDVPDGAYPGDYLVPGETITVTGTFDTYFEGEYEYCTLRNVDLG